MKLSLKTYVSIKSTWKNFRNRFLEINALSSLLSNSMCTLPVSYPTSELLSTPTDLFLKLIFNFKYRIKIYLLLSTRLYIFIILLYQHIEIY